MTCRPAFPVLCATLLAFALSPTSEAGPTPESSSAERVAPTLTAHWEGWRNTRGGLEVASRWNSFVDLHLGIRGSVLGVRDSSIVHVQLRWAENEDRDNPVSKATGALNPVSNLLASDHVRVFNFHCHDTFAGGWEWKIGQLAVDDDFMVSEYAMLFLNGAFGPLPSQVATPLHAGGGGSAAFAIFPVAAPGVWIKHEASPEVAWQSGIYHGGPGADERDNHGFSYLPLSKSGGLAAFAEVAWRHSGGRGTAKFGAAAHSGRFDDFAALRNDALDATRRGLYSVYAVHDWLVWSGTGASTRVGAFARAGYSPQQDRSVVTWYADAGLNVFAPFAGRESDIAGAGVSLSHMGRDYRALYDTAATETTVELTYSAQLTEQLRAQADVQFLHNPARNPASGRRETAVVIGLRATLAF